MGVKVIGKEAVQKGLRSLSKNISSPMIPNQIGIRAVDLVSNRAQRGKDMNDRFFKRYSKKYKEKRAKRGLKGRVDLTVSGNMMAAMGFRAGKKRVSIIFRGKDENLKAHGQHNGNPKNNVPARPFFGLTKKERRKIVRLIKVV